MKYCTKCGQELDDNAQFCTKCGCSVDGVVNAKADSKTNEILQLMVKIFMIVGCVSSAACFFIPLLWTIPMTCSYIKKVKNKEPISTGFKICTLIFVSLVAGIIMLVQDEAVDIIEK